jgi:peptidyl-prolyl cis-trans isomerase D
MLKTIQDRDADRNRWVKITMGVILSIICISMVVTLVPGIMTGSLTGASPDAVATINGQDISYIDAQQEIAFQTRGQTVPQMLRGIYAKQIVDQMVYTRALQVEADRLGITVTADEERERIKQLIPSAFSGDTWLKDRYDNEVQTRTGMTVAQFEQELRDSMLEMKFRQLVTDAVKVTEPEIQQEFRARNEKVTLQYVLIKPTDLASAIHPSDADLSSYYSKNSSKYQVPEKRSSRYALLDTAKLRAATTASDDELRAYYNAHIDQYKVENRVHVEHILFKTVGKTDAEVAEIRQKAQDVLNQAKKGANFEDLAKKYSEDDATKPKGGDLGWIVEGQTVPEFQQAAFTIPKGTISDLVKTEYGFHIIKVLDRETAHTKDFAEVREDILPQVLDDKAANQANDISNQMAAAVRQSDRQSLDDLAKKFNLVLGDTPPASFSEPVGDLGNSPDIHQLVFQLHTGELGQPLRVDRGFVILTVKDILPAHQGTLAEVHDQVLADYQHDQSITLAQTRSSDLSGKVKGGEALDKAAKDLGLTAETSQSIARAGSIPDVGTGKQLESAYSMEIGQVSAPQNIGGNWLVYRVQAKDEPNPVELAAQHDDIQKQLLQQKQDAAYEAFRASLQDELKRQGKLVIHNDVMSRLTSATS